MVSAPSRSVAAIALIVLSGQICRAAQRSARVVAACKAAVRAISPRSFHCHAQLRMHIRLWLPLLLCFGGVAHALDARAPQDVDLSGRWAVNAALSDDVDALLRKRVDQQLKRERRWREQDAHDQGLEAPPAPESLSAPQANRVLGQLRRTLQLYSSVEIKQSAAGAQLELIGDGNQRRFTAGGRSQMSMPEGQLADAEVGWGGDEFVIERKVRKGPRLVERYRLLKKTGQLQVTISWGGDTDEVLSGIKVKRVFDPSTGNEPPPDPEVGPVR
jgi:hypothetical protein